MPYNKLPRLRDPLSRDFVHQTRDMFLEQYKKEPEDLFYKQDVEEIKNMSFLLQRCIISRRKNVQDSFEMLMQMLKWRKEHHLREACDQDFPLEFFKCGAAFLYEPDKFGNQTLYIRSCLLRSVPEVKEALKEYIAYLMYQIDDCTKGKPWAVIMDLTNTGWNNYDIDLLMHFLTLLKEYFPVNVDYVLAINFPWVLSTVWTLAKRLIPPERRDVVIFINQPEVTKFIDQEKLPDFLGGTCEREHQLEPKGCRSVVHHLLDQSESKLSAKRIREIIKVFSEVLPKEQMDSMFKLLEQSGRK